MTLATEPPRFAEPFELVDGTRRPSLRESRELFNNLTLREIRGKYKRTALGHMWSLINPLAVMLMYTLVFAVILKSKPDKGHPSGLNLYALFLMSGLVPWAFFSNALTSGMSSLVANANLLKKVYFRRDVIVGATVASFFVTFGIEMGVLTAALLAFGGMPLPWLPLVVVMMFALAVFALGISLIFSVVNVYFRDVEHLSSLLLLLWFYLTPVVYPMNLVVQATSHRREIFGVEIPLLFLYRCNPMERFVAVFRSLLYDNTWPDWSDAVFCIITAAVTLAIGSWVFGRFEGRVAEEL